MARRRPKVWFDWSYISGLAENDTAEPEIYILGEASQRVLDQLAEIVGWPTRWYEGHQRLDAEWEQRDDVRQLAARIKGELSVPAHLDDLLAELAAARTQAKSESDQTQAILESLAERISFSSGSCCGGATSIVEDATGGDPMVVPPGTEIPNSPYDRGAEEFPPEFGSYSEYDSYLCGAAHQVAETMPGFVVRVHEVIRTMSDVLGIIILVVLAFTAESFLAIAGVVAVAGGILTVFDVLAISDEILALRDAIGLGGLTQTEQDTIAEIDAAYDDIVDAIYCADTADAARFNLEAVLAAAITDATWAAFFTKVYGLKFVMTAIWDGDMNVAGRTDCHCDPGFDECVTCPGFAAAGYDIVPLTFDHAAKQPATEPNQTIEADQGADGAVTLHSVTGSTVYSSPEIHVYFDFPAGTVGYLVEVVSPPTGGSQSLGLVGGGDLYTNGPQAWFAAADEAHAIVLNQGALPGVAQSCADSYAYMFTDMTFPGTYKTRLRTVRNMDTTAIVRVCAIVDPDAVQGV